MVNSLNSCFPRARLSCCFCWFFTSCLCMDSMNLLMSLFLFSPCIRFSTCINLMNIHLRLLTHRFYESSQCIVSVFLCIFFPHAEIYCISTSGLWFLLHYIPSFHCQLFCVNMRSACSMEDTTNSHWYCLHYITTLFGVVTYICSRGATWIQMDFTQILLQFTSHHWVKSYRSILFHLTFLYSQWLCTSNWHCFWLHYIIYDSHNSRPQDKAKLEDECKKADVVVLTYSCERLDTLEHISTYWLPELRRLDVCKIS